MMTPIRVLVDMERLYGFDRDAFTGIAQGAQGHDGIFLDLRQKRSTFFQDLSGTEKWGIITAISDEKELAEILAARVPAVNIANYISEHSRLPVVGNDEHLIGKTAAEFYLNRGFKQFAYFRSQVNVYFDSRRDSFCQTIRKAGFTCEIGPPRGNGNPIKADTNETAGQWLARLPKPLAVMCPFDSDARDAIHAAILAGLRVPEEVSVLGVDNDLNLCLTIWPQISSVATCAARIGQTALRLLLAMIHGGPPPANPILIPPGEVIERGSTGEGAINDPAVAAAIYFMRTHLNERLTVATVADQVAISRRTLERKFEDVLHRTPLQELRRLRMDRAKRLLISTDLEFKEVARRSGLIHPQRLSNLLKQYTGLTPGKFRDQFGQAM